MKIQSSAGIGIQAGSELSLRETNVLTYCKETSAVTTLVYLRFRVKQMMTMSFLLSKVAYVYSGNMTTRELTVMDWCHS